jgi:uncharacterized protein
MSDASPKDLIGYAALHEEALRAVVRAVLERVAHEGSLPGDHHFYISFRTRYPGVSIPDELLARYPDEMTIALQHQFWDLAVGEEGFAVTLHFGGHPKRLEVTYLALTRFFDPSVQYLLQLTPPPPPVIEAPPPAENDEPNVVSLDQFRRK